MSTSSRSRQGGGGGAGGRRERGPLESQSFEERCNFFRGRAGVGRGNQLPSAGSMPFLALLDIPFEWWRKNVPKDYVPVGAKRRIQEVIETVYLEESDEEDGELTLDDLEQGDVSWYGEVKKEVKAEVSEILSRKDVDETFMELPEERIPLANIKLPDIQVEEGEDDYPEIPTMIVDEGEESEDDCFGIPKIMKVEGGLGAALSSQSSDQINAMSLASPLIPVLPPSEYSSHLGIGKYKYPSSPFKKARVTPGRVSLSQPLSSFMRLLETAQPGNGESKLMPIKPPT